MGQGNSKSHKRSSSGVPSIDKEATGSNDGSSPRYTPRPSPDLNEQKNVARVSSDKRYSLPVNAKTNQAKSKTELLPAPVPPISEKQIPLRPKPKPKPRGKPQARHTIAVVTNSDSSLASSSISDDQNTRLADIQLVLFQLCEKKPKYSVLKQMDFESLDEKAQFIVFEAACEILDQASTIERLQSEQRMNRFHNPVKRVKSFDNLDHPHHRKTASASNEAVQLINNEIINNPPRLAKPKVDAGVAELVQQYRSLEKKFAESVLTELTRCSPKLTKGELSGKIHICLKKMLKSASEMKDTKVHEMLDLAAGPKPEVTNNILRVKLQLDPKEAKQTAEALLFRLSALSRVHWETFLSRSDIEFVGKSPLIEQFLSDCAVWAWRVACASFGDVFFGHDSKVYNSDLHNVFEEKGDTICSTTALAGPRTIRYFVWPILYKNKNAIAKGLVQL